MNETAAGGDRLRPYRKSLHQKQFGPAFKKPREIRARFGAFRAMSHQAVPGRTSRPHAPDRLSIKIPGGASQSGGFVAVPYDLRGFPYVVAMVGTIGSMDPTPDASPQPVSGGSPETFPAPPSKVWFGMFDGTRGGRRPTFGVNLNPR
jgi:hypothetical protein